MTAPLADPRSAPAPDPHPTSVASPTTVDDADPAEIVAALGPLLGPERAARLDAVAAGRLDGVHVALEDLRDPHNAGAALRSCEGFGAMNVHVVSAAHRFRSSTRVTQGCEKWLDVARHASPEDCAAALRARGVRLYAALPDAPLTVDDLDAGAPIALAFGNEHTGLSPRLRALADGAFRIPMHGCSQSLNVSVAVAVSLHAVTAARRRSLGRDGDLDPVALLRLRARYYVLELRDWRLVVARARADAARATATSDGARPTTTTDSPRGRAP